MDDYTRAIPPLVNTISLGWINLASAARDIILSMAATRTGAAREVEATCTISKTPVVGSFATKNVPVPPLKEVK
jgi:hypothetical protein